MVLPDDLERTVFYGTALLEYVIGDFTFGRYGHFIMRASLGSALVPILVPTLVLRSLTSPHGLS